MKERQSKSSSSRRSPNESGLPEFLKEKQAANHMAVSVQWLRKRRANGDGPEWVKFSGAVRYPIAALEDYIQASRRRFTGEASNTNRAFSSQPVNWKG